MLKKNQTAIIIGSGISGIAAAIRLKSQGFNVKVFEANNSYGGKLHSFKKKGYRFDFGPSLFTMPKLVKELFEISNKDHKNYFNYKKIKIACTYFYENGMTFSAPTDINDFSKNASKTFNIKEDKIKTYFKSSEKKYNLTAPIFLEKSLHRKDTYLSKKTLKALYNYRNLDLFTTLAKLNKSHFDNENLEQLFNRFATYNGSSPYLTPGIMSMIPHLEHHQGTYFPIGGMHEISNSLYKLAQELGVTFHFKHKVDRIKIKNKKAESIKVKNQMIPADLIVCNVDVELAYKHLLKDIKAPYKTLNQPRSSSALIFYWGVEKKFSNLNLHNIFFSKNYKKEFDSIFRKKMIHDDPSIYVNITAKEEPNDAPKNCENWFVMVNTPHDSGQNWKQVIKQTRQHIISKLNRILKDDIETYITCEEIVDPINLEDKTGSYKGSLYGASSNNKFAAFLRHPNFSPEIDNLYFCGGTVHPGGGIPLCLMSAKIVGNLIEEKYKNEK